MKRLGTLMVAASCAGGLSGASLLAVANVLDLQMNPMTVALRSSETSSPVALPEFAICHHPGVARAALRLAQVEVSPGAVQAVQPAPAFADSEPPLWSGLGPVTFRVTTSNAEAQRYFDQGLRLAYAFNHDEARRAFRKAQRLDPECAMCFWGEALVLGPNINMPMPEEAVPLAVAALAKAQSLAGKTQAHEQALIAALSTRYVADAKAARAPLDAAYAAAMEQVATQFPDDNEIAVLHAEAVMDVSPWDYWQPGGTEPKPQSRAIVPALERVLARDRNHPGAIHYYIHAVEASNRPQRAEPFADRLRGAIPDAGHLVHMPSHIYYRVGRYLDALADNKIAAAVDEAYLEATKAPMGVYRLGYYPHNVHFVLAAAQMSGDGPTVITAANKLQAIIPDDVARGIAMVHPVKAAPYFAHAQFSSPDTILALAEPGEGMPYVKAIWHYARARAHITLRNFDAAMAEANAIAALEQTQDISVLQNSGIPAESVLKLARASIEARIAQARGNLIAAIALFGAAASLQDALPYMEPPYWYYPVRQSLAAVLMQAGRLAEAEDQFSLALRRAPNNGWSYYGLAELHKARGDQESARRAEEQLAKSWIGDRRLLQLSNL
ncbi:MAG TPA: tetratricopeptide repeat protein [Xanthobacteraceae bacterium]|nr:tetratricopeptide repeat protein [Xanthobacteraceae bacterium]